MSTMVLDRVGIDFPIFGANKNLRLSLLSGVTGRRILPKHMQGNTVIIKALEEVSLELKSGDRIGLVGHNGAGKSTLLRVMAGVYYPTCGRLHVEGRLTPLLNLSPGIEVEDTGYENILTVGMLLGMTLAEISDKAPEIIAFSELGDYIHLPVRSYSSGMQARLAFSIATALDPGILLLGEGIGAADARFADKASRRVKEMMERTEILVLAPHSDDLIDSMCDRAALMHHGRPLELGPVESIQRAYRKIVADS